MKKGALYTIWQTLRACFAVLAAIVLRFRRSGWSWFFVEVGRAAYPYANLLRVPIASVTDIYPDIDLDIGDKGLGRIRVSYSGNWPSGLAPMEQFIMANLVSYLQPQMVFEIGTSWGVTALQIAQNTPGTTRVYTLDLPPNPQHRLEDKAGIAFRGTDYEARIILILGDSQHFDFAPYYNKIDFVFVDAAHDYNSVKNDSENARRMLSDDGVIVWHDYPGMSGVRRAVCEFARRYGATYMIRGTHFAIYDPRRKSININEYQSPDRDLSYLKQS